MSIKVLLVLDVFPKVSETFILDQITGLLDRGVDVRILASRLSQDWTKHSEVANYRLMERTSFFAQPESMLSRIIRGAGIVSRACATGRLLKYTEPLSDRSLHDLFLVDTVLKQPKIDIIHAHFGPNGLLAARLKSWHCIDAKLVTSFHGYDLSRFVRENGPQIYDELFSVGDLFLPVSDFFKDRLLELGCPRGKIVVHKMGVHSEDFTALETSPHDRVRLLSIARLTEKKGLSYALMAVKRILDRCDGSCIEYNIVGDGELHEYYEGFIHREGLESHVKLLGWQDRNMVRTLLGMSDIFILPSITAENGDMEGIPVALMEAMASGLPVVTTSHSGNPELVKDGISGYVVPEKSVDILAERVFYLLQNPDIRYAMGQAGRKFVLEHHNADALNSLLLALYKDLLGH